MLERKLPGESENRPMHRESAASHGVCNVREIRETGPRELAGFAPLGGGQPNLQVILLGIGEWISSGPGATISTLLSGVG
jgi:hypothetical protein